MVSLLLLLAVGCDGDQNLNDLETDLSDTEDVSESVCDATVASITPADGEDGVSVYSRVTATFTDEVRSGQFSMELGVAGATDLSADGLSAVFTPTEPFEAGLGYTAEVTVCDVLTEASFTTTTEAEVDPEVVPDRTYALALDEVTWSAPSLIALVSSDFEDRYLLLEVQALDNDARTATVAGGMGVVAGGGIKQQRCVDPWNLDEGTFYNPQLTVGPQTLDVTFGADDGLLPIEDLTLQGSFDASAESLTDITVTGLIDMDPLDEAYGGELDISFCTLSEDTYGEPCVPCADGRVACLQASLTASAMDWVEDLDLDADYVPADDESCE